MTKPEQPISASSAGELCETIQSLVFDAVRLARDESIATVAALRKRVLQFRPDVTEAQVSQALAVWARYA